MKRWLSTTLQIIGGMGQVVNIVEPIMKQEHKIIIAGCIGFAQLVVGVIAHNSNPDGTPAEVAWIPTEKK
jgi:hypothetical protein